MLEQNLSPVRTGCVQKPLEAAVLSHTGSKHRGSNASRDFTRFGPVRPGVGSRKQENNWALRFYLEAAIITGGRRAQFISAVDPGVMHSLAQEIEGFSKNRLRKQCTHVTTVTGKKLLERRSDDGGEEVEQVEELEEGSGCGFVEDESLDLQVGVVRPFLLLGSQDAAHDTGTLQRYKVSHVLNVAYGVNNLFPDQLVYKTLQILDLPDTDITAYLAECSSFIDQAKEQGGVVLVHCNAGVSRSSSITIGYLMLREGLRFDDAYSQVKLARPSVRPNPGFYQQLQNYKP